MTKLEIIPIQVQIPTSQARALAWWPQQYGPNNIMVLGMVVCALSMDYAWEIKVCVLF